MRVRRGRSFIGVILICSILCGGGYAYGYINSNNKRTEKHETIQNKKGPEAVKVDQTKIDVESIKDKINKSGSVVVLKGTTTVISKIDYSEPVKISGTTICNPTITKKASTKVSYQYLIDVKNSKVEYKGNTITITLPKSYLDHDSISISDDVKIDTKESGMNISGHLAMIAESIYSQYKETIDARAERELESQIIKDSPKYIEKAHKDDELSKASKEVIQDIVNSLNINTKIIIK